MRKRRFILYLAVAVLLVGVVVGVWRVQAQDGSVSGLSPLPASAPYQPNNDELSTAELYQRVTQSVVNISVTDGGQQQGTGTGFVVDTDGHIVTNNHVVELASYIEVTFVDGTITDATLVGRDPEADLAVIRVDPAAVALQPVAFADSDEVFVGQQVFAIGSPFNQAFTLTTGIVSALDRSLQNENFFSIPELIQTDAAINPGNSGGPLLDHDGHVIGVNTAILSGTRSASGVGFAIPSNTVRRIVPYLIENGEFEHSWLGIAGTTLLPAQRRAMELDSSVAGVIVSDVTGNSPASRAGLAGATGTVNTPFGRLATGGDIITAINGSPILQMSDLISYLNDQTMPGDTVTLSILRDGSPVQVQVTLAPRQDRLSG